MDVRVGLWRRLSAEELMLLNCGVGEDSWESLGLQGDRTKKKSVLNSHWKDWCWSWNSNTLSTWCKELTDLKRPWCWERLKEEKKGMTEDEMVVWHHWHDGHEFEQAPGVGNGQGSLACCSPWGCKESDKTEWLNWTELNHYPYHSFDSGQTTGREHIPIHQQKIGLKIYWAWFCPPEQDPVFPTVSPSHQEACSSLLSSSIRGQTEEARTINLQTPKWKPQSQKANQNDHMDHSLV